MNLRTCVHPDGKFVFGIHKPRYEVTNLRENSCRGILGLDEEGSPIGNDRNFPETDVKVEGADWIYEVPNPLPFRGATFINRKWADRAAGNPALIALPAQQLLSMTDYFKKEIPDIPPAKAFEALPEPVLLTLAATSTDPDDLIKLARLSCEFIFEGDRPSGLKFRKETGLPAYKNHTLFEVVINNSFLPDIYKEAMVLRPGVQGGSPITAEWGGRAASSHVFEYLRTNSYIPWGHFASNMANDAVRYDINSLSAEDMQGLRHLYYQRTYVRLAEELEIPLPDTGKTIPPENLDLLRDKIISALNSRKTEIPPLMFSSTLWGWNFGFDFTPSHYRLHASHQQIHQQFALVPSKVPAGIAEQTIPAFGCGDLVSDFISRYQQETGKDFFDCYISALLNNERVDGRKDLAGSLVVHEDDNVMLFVPKAQTSQWELNLMTKNTVGNILEANSETRASLDSGILLAQKALAALGARMVTTIEFSKRFDAPGNGQRLLYSFLPKLPYSMGAMSEAQLRFISGHYPEDFAAACRIGLDR